MIAAAAATTTATTVVTAAAAAAAKKYYRLQDIDIWSKVCPTPPPASSTSLPANYHVNKMVSLWGDGDTKTDKGDITKLQIDCVVNAAKSDLSGGGGIDYKIWKAAGEKQMGDACKKLKGCPIGQCKLTPGFQLPAKFVLHTVGPQDQDGTLLTQCYESCLDTMLESGLKSIGFCCIATGIYKFPNIAAAHIALSTVRKWLEVNQDKVDRIIFCVWENADLAIYHNLMKAVYFRDDVDFDIINSGSLSALFTPCNSNTVTAAQKTAVVTKKEKSEEEFAKKLASAAEICVDKIGRKKSSSAVCPVVVKKAKTVTLKSEHEGTKRKGRKQKRVPTGCTAKKQKIDDKEVVKNMEQNETYMLFSSLPSCPDSVKIHHNEITSDISKHDQDGFYYKKAMNVQVYYTVDQEKRSIRLDHLLQRGFPSKGSVIKILTRSDLDKYVYDCPKCVKIIGVKTDIVDDEEGDLTGLWKYKNSSLVTVSYTLDDTQCSIRLNDLHNRGFPYTSLKYYSFLQLKVLSRKMGKSVEEIKDDEVAFMDCLHQVNVYFIHHLEVVSNQELEEFCGPQCYKDRDDLARFHYYGRGQYRYYRRKDLVERLHNDFGQVQCNQFMNDPTHSEFITDDAFNQYLHAINENIRRNKDEYHHLYVQYSGPQCYEDLFHEPDRLTYDVNYKQHSRKEAVFAVPNKNSECIEGLLETFENCRFSLRVCEKCDKIRALGLRAAKKYALCFYHFDESRHFLEFRCDQLHGIENCDSNHDISPVTFDEIELNGKYILYVQENSGYVFGHLITVSVLDVDKMYVKYDVVRTFGSNLWIYDDHTSEPGGGNWLNNISSGNWRVGALSKSTGRWKVNSESPVFKLCKILIDCPHEAKCSEVFYDTHTADVDHDEPTEQIHFRSLLRVRNIHKLMSSLKILYCVKCKRTIPGLEKFDDSWFIEDGSFDKSIKDIYRNSEVVNTTNMFLDQKFSTTNVHSSSDVRASGVCTECSVYYTVDDNSSINPVFIDFADSQSESSQEQDVCSSQEVCKNKDGYRGINKWGPENNFVLDIYADVDQTYGCFMRSLTAAEKLVIHPLHITINVLRCRSTQMPFTKNSSIGFPLKSPMETGEIPWTNFRKLPFLIVIYDNGDDSGVEKEAKINLENIVRARFFMTQRFAHEQYPNGRPRYRFVDDGFCTFTNEQMVKLHDELLQADRDGYAEPEGLRKVYLDESDTELSKTVPKQQVYNWIVSEFPYGQAVYDGCLSDKNLQDKEGNLVFESFWLALKKFIVELDSGKSEDETSNCEDQIVTYDLLFQFAATKGWVNMITTSVKSEMYEEFSVLASGFTNDEGPSVVQGCVYPEISNDPDEIYRTNIQTTALDRRRVTLDRAKKASEWQPGYLQKAFPEVFLSGDADYQQLRPIPINQNGGSSRLEYLKRLSMFKEVQEHTVLTFVINNLLRKHDAMKAATVLLKDVDITSINLPSKEDLLNNPDDVRDMSKFVLQYAPMTRDSKESWKMELQNEIGTKRDLEYLNEFSRPEKKHPTDAILFRTIAFPYRHAYYFHKLFSYGDGEDLSIISHRSAKVISETMVIEWVGTLLAELEIKYLAPFRCPTTNYVMRQEYGRRGNPHQHSVIYSEEYGEKNWKLITELEDTFDCSIQEIEKNSDQHSWTDDEKKTAKSCLLSKWDDAKQEIVDFLDGMYSNWNPCYTSTGKSTGTFNMPDITTINPSDIIDDCLVNGDMYNLDRLYCGIVSYHCRHIVHRGKDGKPAKTDYCYKEELQKDKKASLLKGKTVQKKVVKCTRRKPQDKRAVPAIHIDKHDNKIYQVTFQSNDEWFNGADPFLILLVLGNADTKALVHPAFTKKPTFVFSETDYSATMTLYISPGESAVEYVIKYIGKAPIPIRTDKEIFTDVAKKMDHSMTASGVYQCYIQAAIQGCIPLLAAQHVNLGLPLVFRNTECHSVNVLGRKTFKKNQDPDSDSYLNENRIDEFEARLDNLSPSTSADLDEVQGKMSMHEFFDKYSVSWDKHKRLIVRDRRKVKTRGKDGAEITLTQRLTPHTTMIQANPSRETYGLFCKKMCLWEKRYLSIRDTIHTFSDTEADQERQYWIDEFNTEFPGGEGLETSFKAYVRHYAKKNMNGDDDDDDEDDDDDDDDDDSDDGEPDQQNEGTEKNKVTAIKGKSDRFYQTVDDLLLKPGTENDTSEDDTCVNDEMMTMSKEYMANAKMEDFRKWIPIGENPQVSRIEKRYTEMKKTGGNPVAVYATKPLTKKQEMVKRIITNWVNDRIGEKKLKPLRLFVLGLPGVGKTFAFKVTATEIMTILGDEWKDMMRIAVPTGSVSSHVGFNAQTLHRTFYIRVGHESETLTGNVDKILEIKKLLPDSIILIVFDECSMIPRQLFATICTRLEEAGLSTQDIGFVLFGDPAQISPIGGLPLWCTDESNVHSMKGMMDFRDLFGMKPLTEVKDYQKVKLMSKRKGKDGKMHQDYSKYYEEFGQEVYIGDYNAVYMDETMRTDHSKASKDMKSIQMEGRYGCFTEDGLRNLKSITATESDLNTDPTWNHRTTLTGYHFYSDLHPERCNADSMNATSLVNYSNTTGHGIMAFEAIHSPEKASLSSVPAKEFQSLASKLHLVFGSRVILTVNVNPTLGLFNGASGKFIGPLYLDSTPYEVNSLETIQKAEIGHDNRTTKQVEVTLPSGKTKPIPKGAVLSCLNGNDGFDRQELQDLQEPFIAQLKIPQQPPFLPEYLVVEFPDYSSKGGPPFFEDPALKDCICIKQLTFSRKKKNHELHRVQETRTTFPIELAYVMTHFKGIGDNHVRTELMLHGNFGVPGGFLVGISRNINPKHLYIHPEHWPSVLELKTQRLNEHVLQSQNFERFIRIVGARDMRYYGFDLLDCVPSGIDENVFNKVADQIYQLWSNGAKDEKTICRSIDELIDDSAIHAIYAFMKESDEYLITKKVPHLSRSERFFLDTFVKNKKTTGPVLSAVNAKKIATKQHKPVIVNQKNKKSDSKYPTTTTIATTTATTSTSTSSGQNWQLDPKGLHNIGNTCFLNSVLQMMRVLPCDWSTHASCHRNIEKKLYEIMYLLTSHQSICRDMLVEFKSEVNAAMNNNGEENLQQDAHEAMVKIFELCEHLPQYITFEEELKRICLHCSVLKVTHEHPFLVLHPTRKDMPMQECINTYMHPEKLTDYRCETCGKCASDHSIFNCVKIVTNPSVIFIQLGQLGNRTDNCVIADSQIYINFFPYTLESAIFYDGYMDAGESAGHYVTYTRLDGNWFRFNDSNVRPVSDADIQAAASKFYILCYKKVDLD